MTRSQTLLVAWATAAAWVSVGCAGSGGGNGSVGTQAGTAAGDVTTVASITGSTDLAEVDLAEIDAALAAPLTFVVPQLNAGVSVSGTIGAAGGELSLDLVDGTESEKPVTVVFTVPPGSFDNDVTLTLVGVDGLDTASTSTGDSWHGVEVLPTGVAFPIDGAATLTFSNVDASFADTAVSWDGDGVASAEFTSVSADGEASFAMSTTGGFGGGDEQTAAFDSAFGESADQLRQHLASEQFDAARDLVKHRHDSYVVPLLKAAVQQCGTGLTVAVQTWLQVERMSQVLGGPTGDVQELRPVIDKMASCAREVCTKGDPAAAGQYWNVLVLAMKLGVYDDPTIDSMTKEAMQGLKECATWRLQMLGQTVFSAPQWGTGFESFGASGLVRRSGETVIPMHVTSANNAMWQTAFGTVLTTALGGDASSVSCRIGPYGESALRVTADLLPPAASGDPDEPPQPVITFDPLVGPATVNCGGTETLDDVTTLLFLTPLVAKHLSVTEKGLQHTFVKSEFDDGLTWQYREDFVFPGSDSGGTGKGTITMILTPAASLDPKAVVETTGMYDLLPILQEIMATNR